MGVHGLHKWWYRCLAAGRESSQTGRTRRADAQGPPHRRPAVLDHTHGNLKAVQKLLGHSSISTTGDIYTDWDIDQLAQTLRGDVRARTESESFPPGAPRNPCNGAVYAPGRNRTCDLALRRRALYPLSYRRGGPV